MSEVLKIFKSKDFTPLIVVVFFATLASRTLIFQKGYFNMHDDLQMMRQLQMEKCFLDGQIPCRWVPDMGYGFGFPLFNYYPPLPYLIGQGIRLTGVSFITTAKLTFALSIIFSGITMYFFSKEFFGRLGATLSSVFYIWAPYHAVDVYVRGAMNEAWALVWFPLIFWSSYKLIANKKQNFRWLVLLSLSFFALFTSHNLMVLIFTPFTAIWVLIHLLKEKAWSRLPYLIISGIFSFGLSAFFLLPVLFERSLIDVERLTQFYLDYRAHFVSLGQLLLSRFWGYGDSAWGVNDDGMSFQIGHLHWISSLIVGTLLIIRFFREKGSLLERFRKDRLLLTCSYILIIGWLAAFMTHSRSVWVWQLVEQLRFVQFPWRFLAIVIFAFSFVVGMIPKTLTTFKAHHTSLGQTVARIPNTTVTFVLILLVVAINWNYFEPYGGRMGPLTDQEKFSGEAWGLQQKASNSDYLPKSAKEIPNSPAQGALEVLEGEGTSSEIRQGTDWASFKINIEKDSRDALVRVNIIDFPNWKVFIDGQEVKGFVPVEEKLGRIHVEVPQGEHLVYVSLFNTPPRLLGNLISSVSWLLLIVVVFGRFKFRVS